MQKQDMGHLFPIEVCHSVSEKLEHHGDTDGLSYSWGKR